MTKWLNLISNSNNRWRFSPKFYQQVAPHNYKTIKQNLLGVASTVPGVTDSRSRRVLEDFRMATVQGFLQISGLWLAHFQAVEPWIWATSNGNCILGLVHEAAPLKAAHVLTIRELSFWHDRISSEAHLNDPAKKFKKHLKKILGIGFGIGPTPK